MSQVLPGNAQPQDSQTFYTALVTNAGVLALELVAFVFLKHRLDRIYGPRVFLPPPEKRAVELPRGWWRWLFAVIAVPTPDVLQKNGMDAYMFLRFMRLLIIVFSSMTVITWAVLLPVDSVGLRDPNLSDKLAQLTWSNIPKDATARYAAHIAVVYITTLWMLFLIRIELKHYTAIRHAFLLSHSHARLAQARTVLITNVPNELCDEKELVKWASFVPGGVENVWIYRDTTDLNEDYKLRLKLCKKLEKAVSKLIRQVVKAKSKEDRSSSAAKEELSLQNVQQKEEGKERRKEEQALVEARKRGEEEAMHAEREYEQQRGIRLSAEGTIVASDSGAGEKDKNGPVSYEEYSFHEHDNERTSHEYPPMFRPHRSRTFTSELEAGRLSASDLPPVALHTNDGFSGSSEGSLGREPSLEADVERLAPPEKRPHHRLGFMGLWGKKVDTIEWCMGEIARLNTNIDDKRRILATDGSKPRAMGSVFIQCNLQMGAHVLAQCVSYHQSLMMTNKYIEVSPKDVIWDNIDDSAYETRFRYVTSWMGSLALIGLWFAPVSFVGTLSNVSALCNKISWLCWIRNAPTPVPGIIQGILPPLFLAILFAVLPWLLKGLAWYENVPRWTLLSISVYKRYFLFLVIHGFLIITLSSAIVDTAEQIVNNPTQAVSTLASKLPTASIFFLTWTLTQGLSGAGSALLQIGHLLVHYVRKWLLGRTPRQAYAVTYMMPKVDFGLVMPRMSLLATIALAYSVLAPIINGLAAVSFILFFYSWKFLLTWVFDQPDESETGGEYFIVAIDFLFVGLYIEHVCLAALFFLKISDDIVFVVEAVLMLVLLAFTVLVQILFRRSFRPITEYLPMSLATKAMQERWEKQRALHRARQSELEESEPPDLFSRQGIKSLVNRRIKAPAQKLANEMQKNVAKTAAIPMNLTNYGHETQDVAESNYDLASTSAHSIGNRNAGLRRTASHRTPHVSTTSMSSDRSSDPALSSTAMAASTARDDEDGDLDKDFDVHGFDHPATYEEQPWIWVPKDTFGISSVVVKELRANGVEASDEGSAMDCDGTVEVTKGPPNEEWSGGFDA